MNQAILGAVLMLLVALDLLFLVGLVVAHEVFDTPISMPAETWFALLTAPAVMMGLHAWLTCPDAEFAGDAQKQSK